MMLANCDVELIEPIGPEHAAAEWLAAHGPGIQHLAIETSDIEEEAARLSAAGFKPKDAKPGPGARGGKILYLDPNAICGLLVQLAQPGP